MDGTGNRRVGGRADLKRWSGCGVMRSEGVDGGCINICNRYYYYSYILVVITIDIHVTAELVEETVIVVL